MNLRSNIKQPPVRVLVVDDSRTIRKLIGALLSKDPRICVVGEASDPYQARELIKRLAPDVITLDVEMPRMNGLTFLEKVMRLRPMPVVMVSTRTAEQSEAAIKALSLGAVDCVDLRRLQKGEAGTPKITETILMASKASLKRAPDNRALTNKTKPFTWNGRYVFIGSSTGGVDALIRIFSKYPKNCPPTLVIQHMPQHFLESFTARLDKTVSPSVRLARDGDKMRQGEILVAPGGESHAVVRGLTAPAIALLDDDGEQAYIPSIERAFSSACEFGSSAVAVILTGMGRDGANAMARMRDRGAHTIAQSGRTCVVDGMPCAARNIGAASEVADLDDIARSILNVTGSGN